jgi:hypothetical protein
MHMESPKELRSTSGRPGTGRCRRISRLHQIPGIAVEILEHRHGAIRLFGGRPDEANAFGGELGEVAPEVVRPQKLKRARALGCR